MHKVPSPGHYYLSINWYGILEYIGTIYYYTVCNIHSNVSKVTCYLVNLPIYLKSKK